MGGMGYNLSMVYYGTIFSQVITVWWKLKNITNENVSVCYFKVPFYCATIAYHVELNAYSGGRRHSANIQEKWNHNSGKMLWNRGDPSSDVAIHILFRVGRE